MKIVVIGGGTAGWLAALMIKKVHKKKVDVIVVESSSIGIVGAGEGSTGLLNEIINNVGWNYGCSVEDFFKETNATVKLGIIHKDWKNVGDSYVAPIDGTIKNNFGTNFVLMHTIANKIPFHLSSEKGRMIEKSLSSFYFDENNKIQPIGGNAYHFDAHLVGKYFKKVCGNDVVCIDSKVQTINLDEKGNVKSIGLDNGKTIFGDFFIDASGFSRIMAKKLDINWKSYKNNLPLNTAMPFFLPLTEKIDPVTTAWAQKNGWMWMIPTQERFGCGYVFDDRFISYEEAQKEIEEKLNVKINPIKFLSFDAGRLEKLWHKNVLFVGLSAAFAEPLEATSIHTTILQLRSFVFEYLRNTKEETCNEGSIYSYNKKMLKIYDDMMNFINIHYVGKRNDSDFWKWIFTGEIFTDQTKEFLKMQKHKSISFADLENYYGSAGPDLYNWIMAGLKIINKDLAKKELVFYEQEEIGNTTYKMLLYEFEQISRFMINNTEFIKKIKNLGSGNSVLSNK